MSVLEPVANCYEEMFAARRLERVFARSFLESESTRLEGGQSEPLYQPARHSGERHCLYYREDYFASALHEVAHWCIAGESRRQLLDYGYWYAPDGRNGSQQRAFEEVECKPQALEWFFAKACGYAFRVSMDNLDAGEMQPVGRQRFSQLVYEQVLTWQREGLPSRAGVFFQALCTEFGKELTVAAVPFCLSEVT